MTLTHRHLAVPPGTDPEDLPLDVIDDILDRGDFDDWRALASAVRRDPHGPLADRILRLCRAHDMYGTSRLWPSFIARARGQRAPATASMSLTALRKRAAKTQVDVAAALGVSQSDVSKLERRDDMRISTLRRYITALGGELVMTVQLGDAAFALDSDAEGRS